MSNFLTGLVRRGAGLPLPASIRPAAGPQQIAASVPVSPQVLEPTAKENPAESLVSSGSAMNTEIRKADFAGPSPAIQWPERTLSHAVAVASPQPAAPSPAPSPKFGIDETRLVSHRTGMDEKPSSAGPITARILPTHEVQETGSPLRAVREGSSPQQTPRRGPEPQAAVPQDAAVNAVPVRPVPKQERLPVVRLSQPAAASSAISSRRATEEKRSIQVKIGKVEIRSSQPAPTVRTTRPASTGGFADFNLARNYLDRNLR
jgi:hypothetical protein